MVSVMNAMVTSSYIIDKIPASRTVVHNEWTSINTKIGGSLSATEGFGFIESFECSICCFLMFNPAQLTRCGHQFCHGCLTKCIRENEDDSGREDDPQLFHNCPLCRDPYRVLDVDKCILIQQITRKLKIQCKYTKYGCKYNGYVDSLSKHESACHCRPEHQLVCDDCDGPYTMQLKENHSCVGTLRTRLRQEMSSHNKTYFKLGQLKRKHAELDIDFRNLRSEVDKLKFQNGVTEAAMFGICVQINGKPTDAIGNPSIMICNFCTTVVGTEHYLDHLNDCAKTKKQKREDSGSASPAVETIDILDE